MRREFNLSRFDDDKLDNKGFNTTELLIVIGIIALICIIGIVIGASVINKNKNNKDNIEEFVIKYDANGGEGVMTDTECETAGSCILKNNTFTRTGYEFKGWGISEATLHPTYQPEELYPEDKDITLYAIWELKTITITYDANGGTGTMENTVYEYGVPTVKLSENIYTKKDSTFKKWHIYNPTLDKWYGCTDDKVECNKSSGNKTIGWYDKDEITLYYVSTSDWNSTNSEYDMVFYAEWEQVTYKITYNLNGGTIGKDSPESGVADSTVVIPNPTRSGYTFKNWTVSGKGASIDGNNLKIGTEDVTLTANWMSTLANYIQNLYNDSSLRTSNSLEKDNTNDANIRYVGSNPNNYVTFNDELWRIIGVFNVSDGSKTTKRVKLIRENSLLNASWDSSSSSVNKGRGVNEWSQADVKVLLNDYYATGSSTCNYCTDMKQSSCSNSCTSTVTKLQSSAISMIGNAVWYTGSIPYDEDEGDDVSTVLDSYNKERSNKSGKNCSSSKSYCTDKVTRTTKWTGMVGLIYPSDYGFASTNTNCRSNITYNNNCQQNNWLSSGNSYWTITPRDSTSFANAGHYVGDNALYDNSVSTSFGIRPSVYLKDSIKVVGGKGTQSEPYKLSA